MQKGIRTRIFEAMIFDGSAVDPTTLFARQVHAVLWNCALLLSFLLCLRIEKIIDQNLLLGMGDWWLALAPEVGAVALVVGVFLLCAYFAGPRFARVWWVAFAGSLILTYVLSLCAHQFYLHTGTVLEMQLILFSIVHLSDLRDLIATGIDVSFAGHLFLIVMILVLGISGVVSRRQVAAPSGLFLSLGGVLLGAVLVSLPPPEEKRVQDLASHLGRDIFPVIDDKILEDETAIYEMYRAPTLAHFKIRREPNILLIILESTPAHLVLPHRSRDMESVTPFLDQIAERAIVFDEAYTTVTHTSKALVGILCGMYPVLRMEQYEARPGFLASVPCLPELLKPLGYRTAFMQSATEFENRVGLVMNMGFEHWATMQDLIAPEFQKTGYLGMDEYAMLKPAVEWATQSTQKPFFLSILTVNTHHPYHVPGDGRSALRSSERYEDKHRRAMRYVDGFLQKLIGELELAGAMENTVLIIAGDHGEAFGQHGRFQHDAVPWQEGTHVPLYITGPGWLGTPKSVGGLRTHLDLLPTLLNIIGAEWTGVLPGRDLFATDGHERVVSSCWYAKNCLSVRRQQMKFIFHFGRSSPEVYDLARDPGEQSNLVAETDPDVLQAEEAHALSMYSSVNAYYKPIVADLIERKPAKAPQSASRDSR